MEIHAGFAHHLQPGEFDGMPGLTRYGTGGLSRTEALHEPGFPGGFHPIALGRSQAASVHFDVNILCSGKYCHLCPSFSEKKHTPMGG